MLPGIRKPLVMSGAPLQSWGVVKLSSGLTLSNNYLTFTTNVSTGVQGVQAKKAALSGKTYHEILVSSTGSSASLGLALANALVTSTLGLAYKSAGGLYLNGTLVNSGPASYTAGDVIGFAVDWDANTMWVAKNNSWTGSPGTSGGTSFTGLTGANVMVAAQMTASATGQAMTARFTSGFSYTPPTGFLAWN